MSLRLTTEDISRLIGAGENAEVEFKAVLPPARALAQVIAAFANSNGGTIILGIHDGPGNAAVTGLSEDFRANGVTHKALDLLNRQPIVAYDYVTFQGKRLYVIEVEKSASPIPVEGKLFVRRGANTVLTNPGPSATGKGTIGLIKALATRLNGYRTRATDAKSNFLDHYTSVLNIVSDLGNILHPVDVAQPTVNPEGRILMRILFSSCADNLEIYLTDILYEIFLANPDTLKSAQQVTVKEVLDCADMQEFVLYWAKKKLGKLQRGSVKGFIAENPQIKDLGVLGADEPDQIERILQIRHLYAHRNGIVDEKFLQSFPGEYNINDEHQLSTAKLVEHLTFIADIVEKIDSAAIAKYQLATL